jgi:hypothetical protein
MHSPNRVTLLAVENEMEDDEINLTAEERRTEDRRIEERRKQEIGPPPGIPERRTGRERRLFDRRVQGSTTGQLLVEVGRFAAENMVFRQKGNKAAARRARKHLSQIMKLAKSRRAEISGEIKGLSPGDGAADDGDDADE